MIALEPPVVAAIVSAATALAVAIIGWQVQQATVKRNVSLELERHGQQRTAVLRDRDWIALSDAVSQTEVMRNRCWEIEAVLLRLDDERTDLVHSLSRAFSNQNRRWLDSWGPVTAVRSLRLREALEQRRFECMGRCDTVVAGLLLVERSVNGADLLAVARDVHQLNEELRDFRDMLRSSTLHER